MTTSTARATAPATTDNAGVTFHHAYPIEAIRESKDNPRRGYDPAKLAELAESLKARQLTPCLARPKGTSVHVEGADWPLLELAAGHRRFRAAKLAGLATLMVLVRPMDDEEFLRELNIENLQRDDLHPLEEAQGFETLVKRTGMTAPAIAAKIGKSEKYVYDRLKLLQLVPAAKELFLAGRFEAGHAIILARLTTADQERAIASAEQRYGRVGGLFEVEHVDEAALELPLADEGPRKAVSVREFQAWVDRNVRFKPDEIDTPNLFPDTHQKLQHAAATKLKVVKITREYRVPDEARDAKERTLGANSWKRADGEAELDDDGTPVPSPTCEFPRLGLVVAGRGRGDAFVICVAKDRCVVHWKQEMKEAERARKQRAAGSSGTGTVPKAAAAKPDPNRLPEGLLEKWTAEAIERAATDVVAPRVKAIMAEFKGVSDELLWNFAMAEFYLDGWFKVGSNSYDRRPAVTDYAERIEILLAGLLPGKRSRGDLYPRGAKDVVGARASLAFQVWVARESTTFDTAIGKTVDDRWTAHRAAQAQTSAKPDLATQLRNDQKRVTKESEEHAKKMRAERGIKVVKTGKKAGDVRRAKKAAKAKAKK